MPRLLPRHAVAHLKPCGEQALVLAARPPRSRGVTRACAQVAWSSDSRLFVSASKDSTLKARASCHARQLPALPSGARCPRLLRLILQPAHTARTLPPRQVWDVPTRKLVVDLPGHADEVFCVDWSPNGASVASGGKDKVLTEAVAPLNAARTL